MDQGIYDLAARKLLLDAAVLDGITAAKDGRRGEASETAQVRQTNPLFTNCCRNLCMQMSSSLKVLALQSVSEPSAH